MRRLFYIPTMLAAAVLSLVSCSNNDEVSSEVESPEHSYLAITVRSVGAAPASRATESDFEDGTTAENSISKIRFFFFDVNGNAFPLANASVAGTNYIDKLSSDFVDSVTTRTPNAIEKQVVVDIVSESRNALPVSVIAIVNPDDVHPSFERGVSHSVSSLRDASLLTDRYADNSGSTVKDFAMSNSVYDNNGTSTCASLISGTNIRTTQAEARQHPVNIYVERIAAKVRAKHANTTNWTTVNGKPAYLVGTTQDMYGVTTPENIYAVIDGWGLADEAPQASVEKNIGGTDEWNSWSNASAAATYLGFDPWTDPSYHRCYWEITPVPNTTASTSSSHSPLNYGFEHYTLNLGTTDDGTSVAYTLPNTPTEARTADSETKNTVQTARTKVLVAAHLMKQDASGAWVDADICSYKGVDYVSEEDVKKAILRENTGIWVQADGSTTRSQLTDADIAYISFDSNNSSVKNYQVVAKLASSMESGYTFYTSETGTTTISVADINALLSAAPVNVRHEGMTYYYTPIRHMGESEANLGYFGVVRNHLYDITINTMGGFGTPVYDPKKTIIPVVPTDEASYLSARINVLAWRIVSQSVDLNATK